MDVDELEDEDDVLSVVAVVDAGLVDRTLVLPVEDNAALVDDEGV